MCSSLADHDAARLGRREPDAHTSVTGIGRPRWGVMLVFAVALAARCVYLYEIRTIPSFEEPSVDALAYDAWAQRIASGEWCGDEVFYQAPAYPYFLGLVYWIAGRDLMLVRIIQAVMGATATALVCTAGGRFFGRNAGIAAGLLLAVYPPAVFFDGLIQKTTLGLLLTSLLLYVLARALDAPNRRIFAVLGGLTAALALTRENALVLLPLIPAWGLVQFVGQPPRRRLGWLAAFLGGAAAVLLPVGLRNYVVGRSFALTTSQMGTNFYIGNNPEADGLYAPLVPGRSHPRHERRDATALAERAAGRELTPGEVSRFWFRSAWRFVRARPAAWLELTWRKWSLVWNRFEVPDAEDISVYGEWSRLLRMLGCVLHFGVLAPLAVAGMVIAWPDRRRVWILYLMVAAMAVSVTLFYVFARYRFPLVPLLTLFAGCALVRGTRWLRAGRRRLVAAAVVLAGGMAIWCNRSVVPEAELRSVSYSNLGAICARNGQMTLAERYLAQALELHPYSAPAHRHLGSLRADQGRTPEAHFHRGIAWWSLGDLHAAVEEYRLAIAAHPGFISAHYNLATTLAELERFEEAASAMQRCLDLAHAAGQLALIQEAERQLKAYRAHATGAARQQSTPPPS
jgi:hypothetical protein